MSISYVQVVTEFKLWSDHLGLRSDWAWTNRAFF